MRIGFDAKRLFFNKTGLGVYSRLLLHGLQNNHPDNEYLLFARGAKSSEFFEEFKHFKTISGRGPLWRTWRMTQDVTRHKCHLYHGLSHELPLTLSNRIPTIVTIHDVIFKRQPHLFPAIDRWIYDKKWRYSCESADKIIAVSEHTKSDLLEFYNVRPEKIVVISPPIDLSLNDQSDGQAVKQNQIKYNLPSSYFLYVGTISERKNLQSIIQAMGLLKERQRLPLIVIGTGARHQADIMKSISKLGLQDLVVFMGHVANHDLASFYVGAQALIYPSFYEGFGIPIIEALNNGTPVITSITSSMPEAAGPGAILIDPNQPITIRDAMLEIIENRDLRDRLIQEGKQYIQKYSVQAVSAKVEALYSTLVG